jgi:acetolactate synthase I/II/III large subunit
VHGDGGILYGLAELLTARQERIGAKLLVVDDDGYGILRLIQEREFGRTTGADLDGPDFPALGAALGVPVHEGPLEASLAAALADAGPSLAYLRQELRTLERTA